MKKKIEPSADWVKLAGFTLACMAGATALVVACKDSTTDSPNADHDAAESDDAAASGDATVVEDGGTSDGQSEDASVSSCEESCTERMSECLDDNTERYTFSYCDDDGKCEHATRTMPCDPAPGGGPRCQDGGCVLVLIR